MDNMNHIKQSPLSMTGMGGVVGGFNFKSASAETVYIDDVFSTYVYKGNGGSSRTISNGIDQLGNGAMTWIKNRNGNEDNILVDSERGPTKRLVSNGTGQESTDSSVVHSFKSTGFRIGNSDKVNNSSYTYSSWSFRKQAGFFDIVTYSGTGSTQSVAHSLGTTPGFIMVKALDSSENWSCYHEGADSSAPEDYKIILNQDENAKNSQSAWNDTAPSSTHFTVKSDAEVNGNGTNYVAYLFAGSASTASTARSVDFDGSGDYLEAGGGTDMQFGTGDFTIETFAYFDSVSSGQIYEGRPDGVQGAYISIYFTGTGALSFYTDSSARITATGIVTKQWYHIALVRNSSVTRLYINGIEKGNAYSDSSNYTVRTDGPVIGVSRNLSNNPLNGKLSNYRIVKGTAVYTSSFRPPTEPLTNITNTKLLCCNNSSITGSTVAPTGGTISSGGNPTASTDNPFLDSAAFTFGDSKEGIIKCGSYIGNGSSDGPTINLGWEPQWILFKNVTTSSGRDWCIVDSIRGAIAGSGSVRQLRPNENNSEGNATAVSIEPTGFKITDSNAHYNENGETIIYMAIRRPDGYVGKPAEAGTDVFTIDLGGLNAGDPSWISNFPVDMQYIKDREGTTYNNFLSTRLTHSRYLTLSTNQAQISNAVYTHDYMNGWGNYGSNDALNITSWMWKRHSGFDVVCYKGNSTNRQVPHSLNAVPEMIMVKQRTSATNWEVYHDGLNGGGNPEQYRIALTDSAEVDDNTAWNDTAPTATHFSLGGNTHVNNNDEDLIAFLFASVSGISKVGVYAGSNSAQSITTGFQPRFVMIKNTANTDDWLILDTFRGWAAGDDKRLYWNQSSAQSDYDVGAPTSTGFDLNANVRQFNQAGRYYIYYAHA